ncbi:MAG TPA: hypothetical protein VMS60_02175, partial [Solirubrobacterales bacterium]|nr:hypothetical protein [Solirubrobacterales bacterium]
MNTRRNIVALCMLCALLVFALAVQNASASKGTTAVTCKEGPGDIGAATFNTSHCLPGEASGSFGHYRISQNTTTELTGQAGSAATKLKATLAGVATTLTSTELTMTGSMENKRDPDGEHYIHRTGTMVYKNVLVTPFTKCFVYTDDGTGTPGA